MFIPFRAGKPLAKMRFVKKKYFLYIQPRMESQAYKVTRLNKHVFEFPSAGKNVLLKRVSFDEIEDTIYNLSLGTVTEDGSVNYEDKSNNGDTVAVFATVIECVQTFVKAYPERIVYFKGDTDQKNKVYNEILSRYYEKFSLNFDIFGVIRDEELASIEAFNPQKKYTGFYLKLKK